MKRDNSMSETQGAGLKTLIQASAMSYCFSSANWATAVKGERVQSVPWGPRKLNERTCFCVDKSWHTNETLKVVDKISFYLTECWRVTMPLSSVLF